MLAFEQLPNSMLGSSQGMLNGPASKIKTIEKKGVKVISLAYLGWRDHLEVQVEVYCFSSELVTSDVVVDYANDDPRPHDDQDWDRC